MFHFYNPRPENQGVVMFSKSIEVEHWLKLYTNISLLCIYLVQHNFLKGKRSF